MKTATKKNDAMSLDELRAAEADARKKYDAAAGEVSQIENRLNDPLPTDTSADLIRLGNELGAKKAELAIAKRNYETAVANLRSAEVAARQEQLRETRARLDRGLEELVRTVPEQYLALSASLQALMVKLQAHHDAVNEYNGMRPPGEEQLQSFEQIVRWVPSTPDRTVEVEVEREVFVDTVIYSPSSPTQRVKVKEQRVIHGQRAQRPIPLHIAFELPRLRVTDEEIRVPGAPERRWVDPLDF